MNGGTAEVWASNKTQAVIDGTTSITDFNEFVRRVEDAFGDSNRMQTVRTKLHNLCMTAGMSANEYTAQFKILARCTGFNDEALKDMYAHGLQLAILDKIHSQLALPVDLHAWKESAQHIDLNHHRLLEIKQVQMSHAQPFPCTTTTPQSVNTLSVPPTTHNTINTEVFEQPSTNGH